MTPDHILAIDQGTTSTRAILFDREASVVAVAQAELAQHYPAPGWVEHDPEDIWRDALQVVRDAIAQGGVTPARIAAIAITNQRETAIVWDRSSGEPIHRAIVWQDRRTSEQIAGFAASGAEPEVRAKTGLLLDPYFSATKIAWILDHVPGARARATRGELAFGTVDSFLLWRLTGGRVHATDATNAARTMLFDIHRQQWDQELCRLFAIPMALLPEVRDNDAVFGTTAAGLLDRPIPIAGMAGDQHAALIGQACFEPGTIKATYGTGAFMLMNSGTNATTSAHHLLTTLAYRLGGKVTFAVEGSIFVAGAAVKWLRDGLGVIADAADTDRLAAGVPDHHGVYLVPAFVGLGAPYWRPDARATISGLTLGTTGAHLARAALEAVAFQTLDLVEAMVADGGAVPRSMRIDGGMTANDWLCQCLADIVDVTIERAANLETSALGAAFLGGLATGMWSGLDAVAATWTARDRFSPRLESAARARRISGWHDAIRRVTLM